MIRDEFLALALRNPINVAIIDELHRLALADAWLVSGCLVQTVWNALTGRALDYGIADYDVFYFDADTSWESEDAVIRELQQRLAKLERRHRPLPDAEHAGRRQARRRWLRGLRATRL